MLTSIIEVLPTEILEIISSNLQGDSNDLFHLSLTCKKFNYVSNKHLYHQIVIRPSPTILKQISSHQESYVHSDLTDIEINDELQYQTNRINTLLSTLSNNNFLLHYIDSLYFRSNHLNFLISNQALNDLKIKLSNHLLINCPNLTNLDYKLPNNINLALNDSNQLINKINQLILNNSNNNNLKLSNFNANLLSSNILNENDKLNLLNLFNQTIYNPYNHNNYQKLTFNSSPLYIFNQLHVEDFLLFKNDINNLKLNVSSLTLNHNLLNQYNFDLSNSFDFTSVDYNSYNSYNNYNIYLNSYNAINNLNDPQDTINNDETLLLKNLVSSSDSNTASATNLNYYPLDLNFKNLNHLFNERSLNTVKFTFCDDKNCICFKKHLKDLIYFNNLSSIELVNLPIYNNDEYFVPYDHDHLQKNSKSKSKSKSSSIENLVNEIHSSKSVDFIVSKIISVQKNLQNIKLSFNKKNYKISLNSNIFKSLIKNNKNLIKLDIPLKFSMNNSLASNYNSNYSSSTSLSNLNNSYISSYLSDFNNYNYMNEYYSTDYNNSYSYLNDLSSVNLNTLTSSLNQNLLSPDKKQIEIDQKNIKFLSKKFPDLYYFGDSPLSSLNSHYIPI
ncbi:F-box protein ASCRUDRAFT_78033 [Ascoidea rubescens DSM 1968]|uniref:F-box domain-containing protein n=1 Tax=Ascoidea rubescens DSM 1968 TaxID=1344418 RepID=A0A1D2VA59_9ASCO|nr:hypothetical protein ASCRUDRAFT_78033 [Ascoidea rubescens DSM 1968]ODV58347.1 hypothetical protein ASCRUDRAFT_78033 [Ascoidea rubescens DSM 1968]